MLARPLKENFAAVSFVAATDICCAAALLHLAWTGCTATLSHRAWAMEKLLCDVCSRGAHETSWGHYRVDRGSLAPDLSICRDCYDGLAHGFQPEKLPNYREVGPALRADAVARRRVLAWSSKLQKGGAHVASEGCANFVAESLVTGERVEMIWEDRYDIHLVRDFRGDANSLAALPTTEIKDPRGDVHKVILTDGGQKPVAVVRRIVTLDISKHHLRPETMVCPEQASRLQATTELPFKLPQVVMTTEVYEQLHGGRITPPAQDGCSDSAARGASAAFGRLFGSAPPPVEEPATSAPAPCVRPPCTANSGVTALVQLERAAETSGLRDRAGGSSGKRRCGPGRGHSSVASQAGLLAQSRTPPAKPKKEDADQLTMKNVLEGAVVHPKVLLGWRRQSLRENQERGQMPAAHLCQEIQELETLQAAINLTPEEIGALGDAELQSSLDRVLPRIPDGLPSHVVCALIRREAQSAIKAKNSSLVVDIAWPGGKADVSGFNARAPRLRDFTGTSGRGDAVSHAAPSAEESFWRLAEEVLISEYLAKLMMVKEERSGEITALAQAIATAPSPLAEASGATKYEEILNTSLAIAALVQGTACTTQQIKALRWVSEELEHSAKDGKSSGFSLSIFFDDPWWASLLRRIWSFAADEGTAAPQIAKIVSALVADAQVAEVDEAWTLAESRMLRWKQT